MSAPKIYALLVAIDQYQQVRKLSGCVNDINAVENYLQLSSNLNTSAQKLTNAEATKENIAVAFQEHLAQAEEQDTVLFYYSGHGTQETAASFWDETDGALECIVCYDGNAAKLSDFLLTDKELRFLIHDLYQHTRAHIVTIFDCCNSGDNTRNGALMMAGSDSSLISERSVTPKGARYFPQRDWSQFLFSDLFTAEDLDKSHISTFIPEGKHIQISACESNQTALEINGEGVFTKTLLKTLKDCGGNISYQKLRSRIRQYMRASFEQTPRIYAPIDAEGMLGLGFLNKPIDNQKIFSEATQDKNGVWQINVGAIHGVKSSSQVTLKDPDEPGKSILAKIKKQGVLIDYSLLDATGLDDQKIYNAQIEGLLSQELNLEINNLDATPEQASLLITTLQQQASGGFAFGGEQSAKPTEKDSGKAQPADYTLHLNSGEAYLTLPGQPYQPLIRPIPLLKSVQTEEGISVLDNKIEVLTTLKHISRWHFIKNLQNDAIPVNFPKQPLKIELQYLPSGRPITLIENNRATIEYEKLNGKWQGTIEIKITNTTDQDLYVCAAYLRKEFGCYLDFLPQRVQLLHAGKSILLGPTTRAGVKKDAINLTLGRVPQEYNWAEALESIKFIISTTEFDGEALILEGLPAPLTTADLEKGLAREEERGLEIDDAAVEFSGWLTQTLELVFKNPVHNLIPADVLQVLLNWEETAYFAAGLYCDIEPDATGQPTIWKLKKGINVPEDERNLLDNFKLWLGNKIETAQRNKRYNNLKKDPNRLRIVAEGDSWFQYPILLQDTLDQLYKRYAIKSYAEAGDTLSNYLKKKEYLDAIGTENAGFFLVSGGGNDVLGEEFQYFLRQIPDPSDDTPKRYLNQKFFDQLDTLDKLYHEMFTGLLNRYPDLNILVHCYDYVIPIDVSEPSNRKKSSWSGKYMIDKKIAPQSEREKLIVYILNEFAQRLQALAGKEEFAGKITFVDTRGLVNRNSWFDEIHPVNDGYALVAAKFIAEIERIRTEKKKSIYDLIKPGDILTSQDLFDLLHTYHKHDPDEELFFYKLSSKHKRIKVGKYELSINQIENILQNQPSDGYFQLVLHTDNLLLLEEPAWPESSRAETFPENTKDLLQSAPPAILDAPLPTIVEETSSPLRAGQMDYMIPDKMELNKSVTCIIRVGDKDVKDIQIGDSSVNISTIEVSDEMSVKIIDFDNNFKISPISNERQGLEPGEYTEWKIRVTPLIIGVYPLLLRITCHFNGRSKDVEVLEKSITVLEDLKQPIQRKKIAFVAAGSKSGLLLGKESNEIWEELMLSPYRDDFAYVKYFEVSNIQFNRALSFEKPTVVHFSGHGSLSGIFLANEFGEPVLATNEMMSDFFEVLNREQSHSLECVVLNACLSRELASLLVKTVPIVIGTNMKISDDKAIRFSEFFYRSLGKRQSYREAFASGHKGVSQNDDPLLDDLVICLP